LIVILFQPDSSPGKGSLPRLAQYLSIALAQTYTTIDFGGATAATLRGGPNPQGTIVGSYTETTGVTE
jgi:hypothetical protein